MTEELERHLAAILALDIAGYSRLMSADESGTLTRLRRRRQTIFDPLVAEHRGRVVKGTGDGILAEFASAQNAIRAAQAIQAALTAASAEEPSEPAMIARIGITIGDIFFDTDGDIFGDGVNIAARLESEAPEGGICVSDRLLDDLRRVGAPFSDFGEIRLKNIGHPVRVYCIAPEGVTLPPRPRARPGGIDRRLMLAGGGAAVIAAGAGGWMWWSGAGPAKGSIAVMPFANLSGDPGQSYFSDGLAEELRSALGRLPMLKVIARISSERLRDGDVVDVANRLGVANVLTGSVRRSSDMIRVLAQLIDGKDGAQLWSETYDRKPGDAVALQTALAENVAQELSVTLTAHEKQALGEGGTTNPEALDFYLRASTSFLVVGEEQDKIRAVLAKVDAALALDPSYATAHVLRAAALEWLAAFYATSPAEGQAGFAETAKAAQRGIVLAPNLPGGYTALASVLSLQLRLKQALVEFKRAQKMGEDANFLRLYLIFLAHLGRTREAESVIATLQELDPFNPLTFKHMAWSQWLLRKYPESIAAAQKLTQMAPEEFYSHFFEGVCRLQMGQPEEALALFAKMPADNFHRLNYTALAYIRMGKRAEAERVVTLVGTTFGDANFQTALLAAQQGDTEGAFAALHRAYAARDWALLDVRNDWFLEPIRKDPRYAAFVEKLDFP